MHAVRDKHKSLFAAGIKKITGDFHAQVGKRRAKENMMGSTGRDLRPAGQSAMQAAQRVTKAVPIRSPRHCFGCTPRTACIVPQDCVSICDLSGVEFARGLINFSSEEVGAVAGGGKAAQPVGEQLGFPTMDEVVHRWVG